ncbi:hypothetical protein NMG60_11031671 [Bertholletia excelsa]
MLNYQKFTLFTLLFRQQLPATIHHQQPSVTIAAQWGEKKKKKKNMKITIQGFPRSLSIPIIPLFPLSGRLSPFPIWSDSLHSPFPPFSFPFPFPLPNLEQFSPFLLSPFLVTPPPFPILTSHSGAILKRTLFIVDWSYNYQLLCFASGGLHYLLVFLLLLRVLLFRYLA